MQFFFSNPKPDVKINMHLISCIRYNQYTEEDEFSGCKSVGQEVCKGFCDSRVEYTQGKGLTACTVEYTGTAEGLK